MQVVLVMFRSDGERRSFSVVRNMTVIGRREDCDLRIPVGEVSRKHCRLVMTDDGIRIEDLGSSNGTWVNGQRVQENDLSPGDTVTVGPVQFIVQINGAPDDDELTAPAPPAVPSIDDEDSLMGYTAAPVSHDSGELTIDEAPPAPLAHPAPHEADADEFQFEEEPAAAAPVAEEEFALDEEPAAAAEPTTPDEFAFAEEPAATEPIAEDEFALADEPLAEVEPAGDAKAAVETEDDLELPEFPAATEAAVEDEFEMPDLEAAPETPQGTTTPSADNAGDSEWDFVVEETDTEQSSTDFNIDLDSSHQPNK